ncbi:MAG: hypothetical protein K8S25_17230 [Alphaproteobacteria bacterium]|nr:hypothetical protein [Alphaproteobacteria bacterium]
MPRQAGAFCNVAEADIGIRLDAHDAPARFAHVAHRRLQRLLEGFGITREIEHDDTFHHRDQRIAATALVETILKVVAVAIEPFDHHREFENVHSALGVLQQCGHRFTILKICLA